MGIITPVPLEENKQMIWRVIWFGLIINTGEKFRDVVGYEDYFQISNLGRLYSKRSNKILSQTISKTGYYTHATKIGGRNGIDKCFRIHRLIAQAFIPNPENKPFVNHIDGNKLNNDISNLEWVTNKENIQHASHMGLLNPCKGEDNKFAKLNDDAVRYIREVYTPYSKDYGFRPLAEKFNVSKSVIKGVIYGTSWKHVK